MAGYKDVLSIFKSFRSGYRLIDGGELKQLANLLFSVGPGALTALAGGGASGATQLLTGINNVATVATNNDSVLLPLATPGLTVTVINNGASTLEVYPAQTNPNNAAAAADQIVPHSSTVAGANTTIATGLAAQFICYTQGIWKTMLSG